MQCINPVWILIKTKQLKKKTKKKRQGNLNIDWVFASIKELLKILNMVCC